MEYDSPIGSLLLVVDGEQENRNPINTTKVKIDKFLFFINNAPPFTISVPLSPRNDVTVENKRQKNF